MSDIERANLSKLIDYSSIRSIPEIWDLVKQQFGQTIALHDPHSQPEIKLTCTDLYQQIQPLAAYKPSASNQIQQNQSRTASPSSPTTAPAG